MRWFSRAEIEPLLDFPTVLSLQEAGFVAYSEGRVVMPPVVHFALGAIDSDVHVKCGWIRGERYFVVKVASGFPHNAEEYGLGTIQGSMLLFNASNGRLEALLDDEGYLTSIRTAIAGSIAAKYLAPRQLYAIGIIGTGSQARLQARFLVDQIGCRNLFVWGRDPSAVVQYMGEMANEGYHSIGCATAAEVAAKSNLLVMTTGSREPLLLVEDIFPGSCIIAVGADSPGKQELDPALVRLADRVIVDSRAQCLTQGEVQHAYRLGWLDEHRLLELGEVIVQGQQPCATEEITVVDLTGLGVQDLQIAVAVFESATSDGI